MRTFSNLINSLDRTTKTNTRLDLLVEFFHEIDEEEVLYAVAIFTGKRPKRPVRTSQLREWAAEMAEIPLWLLEESYHVVGDLAETISHLVVQNENIDRPLSWWYHQLLELKKQPDDLKKKFIQNSWQSLDFYGRFVFNKLMTGGFRIGVSSKTITKALAIFADIDEAKMAHILLGEWMPYETKFQEMLDKAESFHVSRPYPFFLAYALDVPVENLNVQDWTAEFKWDGIRGQLIKRRDEITLWSRGEEIVTKQFPEVVDAARELPNGISLDGELLVWKNEFPQPFTSMQKRVNRKSISKKLLSDYPVIFLSYDLMEYDGQDIREQPFLKRRIKLNNLINQLNADSIRISPLLDFDSVDALKVLRNSARQRGAEGLMLKKKDSPYETGRRKGWFKWKLDPYTVDAVLTYAMRGHGRRANLYTDYTFGLWHEGELVTFAKAYSGLKDREFIEVDKFVKSNTLERFGPVRRVKEALVFELAFEGIAPSKRHKSGYAVRFPRMVRWRKDKNPKDANTIADLEQMMRAQ
jgi:DNA ligase-1